VTASLKPLGCFVVRPDHPCLPGHFPGHAIVPGVVLLDETISLILDRLPGAAVAGIAASKFPAMLLPGQVVEVACGPAAQERLDFLCSVEGTVVACGTLRLRFTLAADGQIQTFTSP
jgi:3-hydroxymyristoyl/3-hydroxydecanoyl-(acyl carrier protein) dehydratase